MQRLRDRMCRRLSKFEKARNAIEHMYKIGTKADKLSRGSGGQKCS